MDKKAGRQRQLFIMIGIGLLLAANLACSVGRLLVQAPTPTPTVNKTPRPTYTPTPPQTPTYTPTSTPLPTNTPEPATSTPAAPPTATPRKARNTPAPNPPSGGTPAPKAPAATATAAQPAPTPAPAFPFTVTVYRHPVQGAMETRVTAHVLKIINATSGIADNLLDYRLKLVNAGGTEIISDPSGGANHTTCAGCGDDHYFNVQVKFSPYTPGNYRVILMKDGAQAAAEIAITLGGSPQEYIHVDYFLQ
jgi:hypothetical protein